MLHDSETPQPIAIMAETAPERSQPVIYPEPFFSRVGKQQVRPLGGLFGLNNFGVNLTTLKPGSESALLHRHSRQDEFVYIVKGTPTLFTETEEVLLCPEMCAGFPACGIAHHLVNRSSDDVVYLEIGDRTRGDEGSYPKDDLKATLDTDAKWVFTQKDGRPY